MDNYYTLENDDQNDPTEPLLAQHNVPIEEDGVVTNDTPDTKVEEFNAGPPPSLAPKHTPCMKEPSSHSWIFYLILVVCILLILYLAHLLSTDS
jgi:hypothetical protein